MPIESENAQPSGSRENPCVNNDERYNAPETYNPYCVCQNCASVQRWETMEGWLCSSCYDDQREAAEEREQEEERGEHERDYFKGDSAEFQSESAGTYIVSPRIFSTEIECYYPSYESYTRAFEEINECVGVSGDGSLDDKGVEFQTPKLKGSKGEQLIRHVTRVLNRRDFMVNQSCGLHIHLDGAGLLPSTETTKNPLSLKQLWRFYVAFDEVLLSFLPRSRRGNRYALPMGSRAMLPQIAACKSQRDIEKLWYRTQSTRDIKRRKSHKYDSTRYAGANIHSLLSAGHLEIRFHSGTLNPVKILEWVALHQAILDRASERNLVFIESAIYEADLQTKTSYLFAILNLPQRAQDYFLSRQAMFMRDNEEADATTNESTEATRFEVLSI